MAWHKSVLSVPLVSQRRVSAKPRCAGSFVIEAVVAVMLLATASLAMVRLARSSVDLQLRADRELAAALTAQNVLSRLDDVASDQLGDQIAAVERSYQQESGCDVSISIRPFDREGLSGLHLRVEVTAGQQVRVTLHDWRLDMGPDADVAATAEAVDVAAAIDARSDGERRDRGEQDD